MKNDNKNSIVLLVILALVLIIGGWWGFNMFNEDIHVVDLEQGVQKENFSKVRNMAIDNINDFMDTLSSPGSIFKDLINNEQFNSLEETPVNISQENIGNSKPFSY